MLRLIIAAAIICVGCAADGQGCDGCGCKGGPGYRGPDGQCLSWKRLNSVCGIPPTTHCKPEQVNTKDKDEKPVPK